MIRILLVLAAAYTATAGALPHCGEPDQTTLEAVVRVWSGDGSHASGVVVAPDRVMTVAHVIEEGVRTYVSFGGPFQRARVLALHRDDDLAVLEVPTPTVTPLALSTRPLGSAEEVWAVGYPRASAQAVTTGRVRRHRNGSVYASAGVDFGHSGGGLLRCEGGRHELAGIVKGFLAYRRGGRLERIPDRSVSVGAASIRGLIDAGALNPLRVP